MNLNKKQFQTWLDALRSGYFQQSTGALENKDGFCCLGVACKVLIPKDKLEYEEKSYKNVCLAGTMPSQQNKAPKWLVNIDDDFYKKTGNSLTSLNDSEQLPFTKIADILEAVYVYKVNLRNEDF